MQSRTPLFSILCVGIVFGQACAQVLLDEDFQDGEAKGWVGEPGRGSIQLTEYAGNISMRLVRNASAFRPVNNAAAARLEISAEFAAMDLEGSDACILEFSPNGETWTEVGRITDGQDDGLTLTRVSATVDIASDVRVGDAPTAFVGVRINANAENDICWADNIRVVAIPAESALTQEISLRTLIDGESPTAPFRASAFAPPEHAPAPVIPIEGVLRFAGERADHFQLLHDGFNYAPAAKDLQRLPPVEIEFVQNGNDLVPVKRGPRHGEHPDWEWLVGVGRVWQADDGAMRVSFPFALQERNANCIHNGLAAFHISPEGGVFNLAYQIASETCAYMQFNLWGAGEASFEHRTIPGRDEVIVAYEKEKAARMKTRSIGELPLTGDGAFGSPLEAPPETMTVFGYVAGGVHYVSECRTRFGAYPFCDAMALPSYSWAKSLVAGVAAMRMEKLYPGFMTSHIRDYVPACDSERWAGVTFDHVLNMASGIYNSDIYDEDEASQEMRRFFLAERHGEKIDIACTAFARNAAPGEKFVYRTADTYILGVAMNAFWRKRTGNKDADFYRDLLAPIWTKLGLSPLMMEMRRTRDAAAQPFTGWGLSLNRNDIALLTAFLHNGGVVDGERLLDEEMLNAALQKKTAARGLPAVIDSQRYKNGFWAWNAGPPLGCNADVWTPAMSGFGGLSAALLPNGASYYYVSDGGAFSWRLAARASNQLDPFCEVEE